MVPMVAAMAAEIEGATGSAPAGTVLPRCEEVAMGQGRELTDSSTYVEW